MKYNIRINQKAVYDNHLQDKLDMVDLVLFDFVHDFFNSVSPNKMVYEMGGERFIEIRLSLIQEQMPLLGITSRRTFIRRMNNLVDAGLIERYEHNQKEGKSCYKRGPKWDIFTFYETSAPYSECNGCDNEVTPCDRKVTPCDTDVTPCDTDFTERVTQMSHNNNIIDNNNIVVVDARTRTCEGREDEDEGLVSEFMNSGKAQKFCMDFHIGMDALQDTVCDVISDWRLTKQTHTGYSDKMKHLIAHTRKKLEAMRDNEKPSVYGIHQQSFRQQERQRDFDQYAAAHEEVERRRRAEQFGCGDDTGDIL